MKYCPPIIEYITDDPLTKELINDYWTFNPEKGRFISTQVFLITKYKRTFLAITKLVSEASRVYSEMDKCRCGTVVKHYNERTDFEIQKLADDKPLCKICFKKIDQQFQEHIISLMKFALEEKRHHQLTNLEFNIFRDVVLSKEFNTVRKKVGMSEKVFAPIREKLFSLYLITTSINSGELTVLDEYNLMMQEMKERKFVKSVFNSTKNRELYTKLCSEHAFVYPEQVMCSFIKKEDVQHLFTEPWHYNYFLTCRFDFVVCDWEGIPRFVVEYQGSLHAEKEQIKRDEFKRRIVEFVGIPVVYY